MAARIRKKPQPRHSLASALFPRTKQRVLGLLFGQPERTFGTVELIGLARSGRGAVQRELEVLAAAGLIDTVAAGAQKRHRANPRSPVFDELRSIVAKTSGIPGALRAALAPIAARVELAILYGSVAKATDTAHSDIDLLLVANDLTLEDVFRTLEPAEAELGRRINPTLYTPVEFSGRRQAKQPFLAKLLSGPHIVLMGSLDADRATR